MPARVSVLVTTFNHRPFIADALESIFAQTYRDLEVVVADDGSTDGTLEIVQRYGSCRIVTGENLGYAGNWARGLKECGGELIAFLPGDDVWLPNHLEIGIAALDANPHCAFSYSHNQHVDEALRPLPGEPTGAPPVRPSGWIDARDLLPMNFIEGQSVIVRREAIERIGGLDSSLVFIDLDLFFRLVSAYPIVYTGHTAALYRRHAGGMSRDKQGMLDARLALYEKHLPGRWGYRRRRLTSAAHLRTAYHQARHGTTRENRVLARRNLAKASFAWPPVVLNPLYIAVTVATFSPRSVSAYRQRWAASSRVKPRLQRIVNRWLEQTVRPFT